MSMDYSHPAYDGAVALIGMALRAPGADTPEAFWRNLRDGVCSISRFDAGQLRAAGVSERMIADPHFVPAAGVLDDVERFDAGFFGFTPRETACLSPQNRLLFECVWEALESAGYNPRATPRRTGLFVGRSADEYWPRNVLPNTSDLDAGLDFYDNHDFLATGIAYRLNLRGPAMTVQSFCSTSLLAVHIARQSLLEGECDMALAGAASVRTPQHQGYVYVPDSIFSPDGVVRTFDAEANGTLFSSGVGVVVMKRLEDALADGDVIDAIIRGSAANNDGAAKAGYNAPSVEGQAFAIADALRDAEVEADSIDYVECHGTGTILGDPVEVAAMTRAFRMFTQERGFCALGSVKTNVGHCDRAAGVIGLIKTVLSLRHAQIPPSLNYRTPNPRIDFDASPFFVNDRDRAWPQRNGPRRAGVSSLGYGGTNVHAILEEAPPRAAAPQTKAPQVLVLSGRSPQIVQRLAGRLADALEAQPESSPADVAHTLQVGRCGFNHRLAIACDDIPEAIRKLRQGAEIVETTRRNPAIHLVVAEAGVTPLPLALTVAQRLGHWGLAISTLFTDETPPDDAGCPVRPLRDLASGVTDDDCVVFLGGAPHSSVPGTPIAVSLGDGNLGATLAGLLGRLWEAGAEPDWRAVYGETAPRRVRLPTTPYERQRHWLEAVRETPADRRPAAIQAPVRMAAPSWRIVHAPSRLAAEPGRTRIVVLDGFGVGETLTAALERQGETVVRVRAGKRMENTADGEYTVDIGDEDQIEALLTRLKIWDPRALTLCAGLTGTAVAARHGDDADDGLEASFFVPARWIRAVNAVWPDKPFRMDILSHGMFQVSGGDRRVPENAALPPLVMAAAQEHPNLDLHCLDLDPSAVSAEATAKDLDADLPVIAARRGRRLWTRGMVSVDPSEDAPRLKDRLRPGGTYLITGGLGGIGHTIARKLAKAYGARLVLTSRTSPEDASDGDRVARLDALRALTPDLLVVAADAADATAMAQAFAEARARFGRIDGVVHTAGLLGGGLLQALDERHARRVFAAKVRGTRILLDLLRADPPDFLVLCSSMAAVVPFAGQADYAAANAVMDGLAETPDLPFPVLSVNWNTWRGIGMQHDAWRGRASVTAIDHPVFSEKRQEPDGCVRYVGALSPARHWMVGEHRLFGQPTLPGSGVIELMLSAWADHRGGFCPVELAPVVFVEPLKMDAAQTRTLHLILRDDEAGTDVRLETPDEDGEPRLHARATLRPLDGRQPSSPADPKDTTPVDLSPPNPEELALGPRWDCLRSVALSDTGARVEARLTEAFADDADEVVLHPALFDMATSAPLRARREGRGLGLPVGFGAVRVFAVPGAAMTAIVPSPPAVDDGEASRVSMQILDAAGKPAVEIDDFTVCDPDGAADTVTRMLDRIPATPASDANPFEADSVSPAEGWDLFTRLPLGDEPQVLVSRAAMDMAAAVAAVRGAGGGPAAPVPPDDAGAYLKALWERILGATVPSDEANFFELGGNSLGATRILARFREAFGATIGIGEFFKEPTIAALVRRVDATSNPPLAEERESGSL